MVNVQLKKKVQLKQKNEIPAVTLKRKSETASAETLKKMPEVAVGVATAATGTNGAGKTSSAGESKKRGTSAPSGSNVGDKKRGKSWFWILCLAAIAGLAFGVYKFTTDDGGKTPSNIVADNTESEDPPTTDTAKADTAIIADGRDASDNGTQTPGGSASVSCKDGSSIDAPSSSSGSAGNENSPNSTDGKVSTFSTGNSTDSTSQSSKAWSENSNVSSNSENKTFSNEESSDVNPKESSRTVVKSVSDSQVVCLFAFDSSAVCEDEILNKLAELAKSSGKKLGINAYTDEVGPDDYNRALSQKRADAVKEYFVKRGVNAEIILAKGNGETTQYATLAENRRADITIQ